MKSIVIFDSSYGNTRQIADIIAEALDADAVSVTDVSPLTIEHADLIILGSPTQGGRPTKRLQRFIESLDDRAIRDKSFAVFDTRFLSSEQDAAVRLLMKMINYAAPRMAKTLRDKGATLVTGPEGFYVHDTGGPINLGEIERAKSWARNILVKKGVPA